MEDLSASFQAFDEIVDAELGLDRDGHALALRADTIGDVSYVTICERLRRGDTDVESYLVLACDLAPDGRLARIEAFIRRTA